ncbi:MAG: hypothetical protein Q7U88_13460 [Desulfocapsaceae bacterium]|nr:hypothetical protein [Desulfocapsaceae bacterium]
MKIHFLLLLITFHINIIDNIVLVLGIYYFMFDTMAKHILIFCLWNGCFLKGREVVTISDCAVTIECLEQDIDRMTGLQCDRDLFSQNFPASPINYRRKIDKPQIPTPPGTFNINQHCALGAYESADP